MTTSEIAVVIAGPGLQMLGILSPPTTQPVGRPTGVVLVVGGAQYRAGSHRQCVTLARRLAQAGIACLRFDLPGLGDSPGSPLSFEDTAEPLGRAIDTLSRHRPGLQQTVLWGLCDGASACLLYLNRVSDPRVAGLVLLNPWLRAETSLARTQVKHYYGRRIQSPDFWRKLIRGGVGWTALKALGRTWAQSRSLAPEVAADSYQGQMARSWHAFAGRMLLLLSESDLTAQAFVEHANTDAHWTAWDKHPGLQQLHLSGADHTCSSAGATEQAEAAVVNWVLTLNAPPHPR